MTTLEIIVNIVGNLIILSIVQNAVVVHKQVNIFVKIPPIPKAKIWKQCVPRYRSPLPRIHLEIVRVVIVGIISIVIKGIVLIIHMHGITPNSLFARKPVGGRKRSLRDAT